MEPRRDFASYLLRFRFLEKSIFPFWFHFFISSEHGRMLIKDNAISSAGQHNISLSARHSMPIPLPPLEEQRQIVAEVSLFVNGAFTFP
ncbi:MAG: restriction endonuclease subunit S [Thermogemmatispora sp.]|nr:restriction endonuclease subunit S [Thermogemmatispora sp.]